MNAETRPTKRLLCDCRWTVHCRNFGLPGWAKMAAAFVHHR